MTSLACGWRLLMRCSCKQRRHPCWMTREATVRVDISDPEESPPTWSAESRRSPSGSRVPSVNATSPRSERRSPERSTPDRQRSAPRCSGSIEDRHTSVVAGVAPVTGRLVRRAGDPAVPDGGQCLGPAVRRSRSAAGAA